jgi:predicted nucleic-acid-binding protein
MNQTDFTYILQHPKAITPEQTEAIKSVINEYPYFQSARAVYLKGLKDQSSFKYNQELKTTAAYTADRSILFDFITSEDFIQNEISQFIKQNETHLKAIDVELEDISVNESVANDFALKQHIKDTKGVLDPELFQPKNKRPKKAFVLDETETIENVTAETRTQEASVSDLLKLGKPLQFDKKESHSFNEWLKLTRFKPVKRDEKQDKLEVKTNQTSQEIDDEKAKKFELIDKFITKNPKINPLKATTPKGNLAKAQMIQPEALMTETLARIYVEQKNYKSAIQSYKILSLKYPEKSSFFANQIKAIKQLQEQNNKE